MFTKKTMLVAAAAVFCATGAFAQEATPTPGLENFKSTKSRAEVVADTTAAASSGQIARTDYDFYRVADGRDFQPAKARVQVVAEAREALRLGLVGHGEGPMPQATSAQLESIRLAGERALMGRSQLAQK